MRFTQKRVLTFGNCRLLCCTLWTNFALLGDPDTAPRVITAERSPSRAVPPAVSVGEPPIYLANDPMSSSRPPTFWPMRSTDE